MELQLGQKFYFIRYPGDDVTEGVVTRIVQDLKEGAMYYCGNQPVRPEFCYTSPLEAIQRIYDDIEAQRQYRIDQVEKIKKKYLENNSDLSKDGKF